MKAEASDTAQKTITQLELAAQELAKAAKRLNDIDGMVGDSGPLREVYYEIGEAQTIIAGHAAQIAADNVILRCGVEL